MLDGLMLCLPIGNIEVASGAVLDREVKPSYSLMLVARDGGSRTMSSSVDVTVTLTDVNDHEPDFGPGPFTASVIEVMKEEQHCHHDNQSFLAANFILLLLLELSCRHFSNIYHGNRF